MEKATKQLKQSSIFVLLFAGLSLLQIIGFLLWGDLNSAEIPEGSPENILLITKIFLLSLSVVMLLPKIYVGFKGLKIAKNPTPAKAHLFWAVIILVFNVLNLIEPAVAAVKNGISYDSATSFFSVLLDVVIIYEYIMHARAVAKAL